MNRDGRSDEKEAEDEHIAKLCWRRIGHASLGHVNTESSNEVRDADRAPDRAAELLAICGLPKTTKPRQVTRGEELPTDTGPMYTPLDCPCPSQRSGDTRRKTSHVIEAEDGFVPVTASIPRSKADLKTVIKKREAAPASGHSSPDRFIELFPRTKQKTTIDVLYAQLIAPLLAHVASR